MHKTKYGITKIKPPKIGQLYRLEGQTDPSFLYVIERTDSFNVYVKVLKENGHTFSLRINRYLFINMWGNYSNAVNNIKEQTLAILQGLI